jgi:hypothetical protein
VQFDRRNNVAHGARLDGLTVVIGGLVIAAVGFAGYIAYDIRSASAPPVAQTHAAFMADATRKLEAEARSKAKAQEDARKEALIAAQNRAAGSATLTAPRIEPPPGVTMVNFRRLDDNMTPRGGGHDLG